LKDVTIVPLDQGGYGLCDRRGLLTSKRLKDLRKIQSVGVGLPGLDLSSRLGDILKGMRSDYGSRTLAVVDRANAQNFVAAGANWEKSGNVWDGRGFYSVRSQPFKAENSNFFHKVGYCVDKLSSVVNKPLSVMADFVFEAPVSVYSTFKKSLSSVRAKFTAGVNFLGSRFANVFTQDKEAEENARMERLEEELEKEREARKLLEQRVKENTEKINGLEIDVNTATNIGVAALSRNLKNDIELEIPEVNTEVDMVNVRNNFNHIINSKATDISEGPGLFESTDANWFN
jgi:hypothetical protein